MIAYHGTTRQSARKISVEGLLPRRPSKRVWFAVAKSYALRRAKTQARRRRDKPIVLRCDLNLHELRKRYSNRRVFCNGGLISISGPVPVSVLTDFPSYYGAPFTPPEIAQWVNRLLQIPAHKGAGAHHAGTLRLYDWLERRRVHRPRGRIRYEELCEHARQAFPELFARYDPIAPAKGKAFWQSVPTVDVSTDEVEEIPSDPREEMALELLEDERPENRIRGLRLLQRLQDPDLFEWCVAFLEDDSSRVVIKALRLIGSCEEGDPEVIVPLLESENRSIRAAAMGALARLDEENRADWIDAGLRDPEPCVRLAVLPMLNALDPRAHRRPFECALHDPNADVRRRARKLTRGKGFHQRWHS